MKEGLKWSIFGGVVGLFLVIVASWIIFRILKIWPSLKFDEMLMISFSIYSGVFVWALNILNARKKKDEQRIYEEIDKKATKSDLENLTNHLNYHKETNEAQFDAIHEFLTFMDKKLDILIDDKK